MSKILLVEDEADLALIVADTLRGQGYEVLTAGNGIDGLDKFKTCGADIVVADVMMPEMDGFTMARAIRKTSPAVPLLFLTAKSTIDDVEKGFEIGANDYLKKPFKMLELIVRIKALLRRNVREEDNLFEIGAYTLDLSTQVLSHKDNGGIELSLIEAKLLRELIVNVGHTVDASTMMQLIWQRDDPYSRNSLHGFIHKLRNYLRHDQSISLINQRGIGYMLTVKC